MIDNLFSRVAYPVGKINLPILLCVHGWDSDIVADDLIKRRALQYDLFCVAISMRGRKQSGGAADASGLEAHDIYDALVKIRSKYSGIVSQTIAGYDGASGGGGNGWNVLSKFPDTFVTAMIYFGMSDYGFDVTYGWHQQEPDYRASIESRVGGTPVAVPNNYRSRYSIAGVTNFAGGHVVFAHDSGDPYVDISHSDRIKNVLDGAGMTNYTYLRSTDGYYAHTIDMLNGPASLYAESVYVPLLKTTPAWTIAASGTVMVNGYIVTKRFKIYLGTGKDHAASVVYNTATKSYTVTPITTGSMAVRIEQDGIVATQTISSETTIVLS